MKNILSRRNSRCVQRSLGTEQHQVFKELTESAERPEDIMRVIQITLMCTEEERVPYLPAGSAD